MKERGILFSGEMVRALLTGRKTQTRRVILPQPKIQLYQLSPGPWFAPEMPNDPNTPDGRYEIRCPYGKVGDGLWVRETWGEGPDESPDQSEGGTVFYRADEINHTFPIRWCPSIHMPRWASRITLEIVNVRVECVQDITAQDTLAEGVSLTSFWTPDEVDSMPFEEKMWDDFEFWNRYPQMVYRRLWDSINEKRGYGWDKNPWVWCIEFKKV